MSDDFSSGIGGGSSLTFQEKIDEFFQNISIKWNETLDSLDEKGVHLRGLNDFFEEKGIPALPAMLLILLLIIGAAFMAFTIISAPATHEYSFKVVDLDGKPVSGASVSVTYTYNGEAQTKEAQTNDNGIIKFQDIPSDTVDATIAANDFETTQATSLATQPTADLVTIKLNPVVNTDVTVLVTISGAPLATVEILDSTGASIANAIASPSAALTVQPNAQYKVKATAEGYRTEEKDLSVQTANIPAFPIEMFKIGEDKTTPISIRVFEDSTGLESQPIANATVTIRDATTDAVLKQLTTSELGDTEQIRLKTGTQFTITAKQDNYLPKTTSAFTASNDQQLYSVKLLKRTAENSKNIVVVITDENGDSVQTPFVNLYCNGQLLETTTPRDGAAAFDVPIGTTCTVTASQNGYLATGKTLTSKDEQTLILEKATDSNSGQLTVTVTDENQNPVPSAQINIKEINGLPLGVAAIETDLDGKATFDYIPLRPLLITASTGPRQGTQTVTIKNTSNEVSIVLQAAKAIIDFQLTDHYTGKTIPTAQITVEDSIGQNQTCATVAGTCTLSISDGNANVKITSRGYETLENQITATGGVRETKKIELISNSVSNKAKLIYTGTYDIHGKKVTTLAPNTIYKVKYLIRAIETNFTTATAFIQIGDTQTDLENLPAVIIDYTAQGAKSKTAGVDFSSADFFTPNEPEQNQGSLIQLDENKKPIQSTQRNSTTALENGDLSATKTTTGTSLSKNTKSYKWAQFQFDKFTSTKEITLTIETKLAKDAKVELFHRSEYQTTKDETIRQPQDDQAGKTKSPLYAKLEKSASLEISFQGDCSETTCLQITIDALAGEQSADKQATVNIPETFKINFKILSLDNTPQTVRLESEAATNPPVEIIDAFIGGEKIKPANPNTITAALKKTNTGEFTLRAKKIANEYLLKFTAADYEKQISLRVVNPKNTLKVTTTPQNLEAFKENKITFKVTDSFDQPINDASITIEGDAIDAPIEAVASTDKNGKPIYTAQVNPQNPGSLKYTTTLEGYKKQTGDLNVLFKKIIEVTPKTKMVLTADSQDAQTNAITITNLLSKTKVKVNVNTLLTTPSKYALITTSQSTFTLDGGASKEIQIKTKLRDEFLPVANTQNTIKDTNDGTITINAKVAASTTSQTEKIPVTLNTNAQQQPLNSLIDVSQESINLEVKPPKTRKATTKLKVTNNAPVPIVLNQQSDLGNVKVTPASATILPKQSTEFTVTATPSLQFQSEQCTVGEITEDGKLTLVATANKIQTQKDVTLEVRSTTDERCNTGGIPITLPMDARIQFPTGTQVSQQVAKDGTMTAILPDGQAIVFYDGAQVGPQEAYVPADVPFEVAPQLAMPIPSNKQENQPGLEIRLPANTVLSSLIDGTETNLAGNLIRLQNQYWELTFEKYNFNAYSPIGFNGKQYRAQFAPTMQQFGLNSQKTYFLPQYAPIQIFRSQLTTGEFKIKFDKNKNAAAPKGANIQNTQNGLQILFTECTRLQLSNTDGDKQITDVLPAARSIEIIGASANANNLKIPAGSEIRVETCTDVPNEDDKFYSTTAETDVSFVASPRVENPINNNFDIVMPECIDIKYAPGGYSFGIDKAKRINFPTTITRKTNQDSDIQSDVQIINVENGETINFLPCNGASGATSTYLVKSNIKNSRLFTVTNQKGDTDVTFELSDAIKEDTVELCLNNYKTETLYPGATQRDANSKKYDSYFLEVTKDNAVREAITPESLSKTAKSETYAAPLSATKKNECNNRVTLKAKLPASLLDASGCVKQDKGLTSQVVFAAASKKTTDTYKAELTVTLKINQDAQKCQATRNEKSNIALNGLRINLENTPANIDEITRKPPVMDFKGTGENHSLHFTITNNDLVPLQIIINNPSSITCQAPQTLAAGDAALAKCTPLTPTLADKIEIRATGPTGQTYTSEVQITIQDQNTLSQQAKDLYTSSPEGTIAPGFLDAQAAQTQQTINPTETMQASYLLQFADEKTTTSAQPEEQLTGALFTCQRHFCSLPQAQQAYRDFMSLVSKHAEDVTSTHERVTQFCADQTAGRKLSKSVILLLADSNENYAEITEQKRASQFQESIAKNSELKGCGYYKLRATVDPCSGTALGGKDAKDIRSATTIEVEQIEKLETCNATLANAPLYVAGNLQDTNIYVGRQTVGFTVATNAGFKEILRSPSKALGVIALGPYAQSRNPDDTDTTLAFLKTVFGERTPDAQVNVAQSYNDNAFCEVQGAKQVGALVGAQAGLAVTFAAFGGFPVAAKLAYGAGQALVGCGITTAAQGLVTATGLARSDDFVCTSINFCIREALTSPFAVPGAGTAAAAGDVAKAAGKGLGTVTNVKGVIGSTAVAAGVIGTVNAFQGDIEDKLPTMPLSAAGPLGRRTATLFSIKSKTDNLLDAMRAQGGSLAEIADSKDGKKFATEILKQEKQNPGASVLQLAQVAPATTATATATDVQLLANARSANNPELIPLDQALKTAQEKASNAADTFRAAQSEYDAKLAAAIEQTGNAKTTAELRANEVKAEFEALEKANRELTNARGALSSAEQAVKQAEAKILPELRTASNAANAADKAAADAAAKNAKAPTASEKIKTLNSEDKIKLQQIATDLNAKQAGKIGTIVADKLTSQLDSTKFTQTEIEELTSKISAASTGEEAEKIAAKALREKAGITLADTSDEAAAKLLALLNPAQQQKYVSAEGLLKGSKGTAKILEDISEKGNGAFTRDLRVAAEQALAANKGKLVNSLPELKPPTPKTPIKSRLKGLAVLAGLQLAFDVDVRPVQFEIPTQSKSALVVYHLKDYSASPMKPTSKALCYINQDGKCTEKYYLTNLCDSDTDACLYVYEQENHPTTYFFVLNNQQIDKETLFRSIMTPGEPLAKFENEKIKIAKLTDLTQFKEDADPIGQSSGVKDYDQDAADAFKQRRAKTQTITAQK